MNFWIETVSGKAVDLTTPKPEDICIEDIAHALGNICRFVGHSRRFYSVAQHSVIVSRGSAPFPVHGLLHDAAEAYLGDISLPFKKAMENNRDLLTFTRSEAFFMGAIAGALGVPDLGDSNAAWKPIVKRADIRALATERRDLMPATGTEWPVLEGVTPFAETIEPLPPAEATELFLSRWRALMGEAVAQ